MPNAAPEKTCVRCGISKPRAEFGFHRKTLDNLNSYCRPCKVNIQRAWRASLGGKLRNLLSAAKARARKDGREFTLVLADLEALYAAQEGLCALTGEELDVAPNANGTAATRTSMTLDRIDSAVGYVPDNVQLVTMQANLAKNRWSQGELLDFCRKVLSTNGELG